jgi:hypothetical protein
MLQFADDRVADFMNMDMLDAHVWPRAMPPAPQNLDRPASHGARTISVRPDVRLR